MNTGTDTGIGLVGDELTAAGYRLAGARTWILKQEDVGETFDRACAACRVVLITPDCAARLPARRLARARAGVAPLVLVVPGVQGAAMPDLAAAVRRGLGLEP